jgi:hypothetical protein
MELQGAAKDGCSDKLEVLLNASLIRGFQVPQELNLPLPEE